MSKRSTASSGARKTAASSASVPKKASKRARASLTRERQPMPAFVKRALTERKLMAAYRERPPYQQNDYLMWINKAKLEATKAQRLAQMLAELDGGTRYMRMAWRPGVAGPPPRG